MSLQWTFIASFLYVEIFLVIILLLPFISPSRWQKVFRSRIISTVSAYSNIYFNVLIAVLLLFFVDSVREVNKYSGPTSEVDLKHNPDSENLAHMKLFRAQRNFYITGFALFLWFILRRLVNLIAEQARVIADRDASHKQAETATNMAKSLLDDQDNKLNQKKESQKSSNDKDGSASDNEEKSLAQKLDNTKEELIKTKDELKRAKLDLESMRKQAEATNKEYDRLLKEHAKLQESVAGEGNKKDN